MFTGIIEEVGRIAKHRAARRKSADHDRRRETPKELKTGDSVAVSGVCLTALDIKPGSFCADLAPETWVRTSFSRIHEGALVNLELAHEGRRALWRAHRARTRGWRRQADRARAHRRLGELVAAHRTSRRGREIHRLQRLDFDRRHQPDGGKLEKNRCTIAIIPHTVEMTNLHSLKARRSGQPGSGSDREICREDDEGRRRESSLTIEELVEQGF